MEDEVYKQPNIFFSCNVSQKNMPLHMADTVQYAVLNLLHSTMWTRSYLK